MRYGPSSLSDPSLKTKQESSHDLGKRVRYTTYEFVETLQWSYIKLYRWHYDVAAEVCSLSIYMTNMRFHV